MPISPTVGSTLTLVGAAVLAFDGLALAGLGYTSGRLVLILVGLVFVLSAGLLLIYRRWYRRRLDDILAARRALSEEARALREIVSGKRKA
ncbi:MAG TPA: hypothetical protein VNO19_02220 [Gemmatimonadales bacterium]|nr:hypothetical protein [Gemmatimonadales bacterium]